MAIIKMGGLITEITGKIGGAVFQQGTYGNVMKNNRFKRSRQSAIAYEKRSMFTYLSQYGRGLSQANRDAKTGSGALITRPTKQGPATPYDWWSFHMSFNGKLYEIGQTLVNGGFTAPAMPDETGFIFGDELGTTNWNLKNANTVTPDYYVIFKASAPVPTANAYRPGRMKTIQISVGISADIAVLRTNYEAVFGTIATGQFAWFAWQIVEKNTGYYSQPKITKADAQ